MRRRHAAGHQGGDQADAAHALHVQVGAWVCVGEGSPTRAWNPGAVRRQGVGLDRSDYPLIPRFSDLIRRRGAMKKIGLFTHASSSRFSQLLRLARPTSVGMLRLRSR